MSAELAIYFAAAVRGGASPAKLATRIDALSTIGHVLTEHMASPRTIDLGGRDDVTIHAHDQALLARAHVFVADVSQPSTGTGYMVARAIARGLPVLCLYEAGQTPSAMIAGSPDITTRYITDEADFLRQVREFLLAHADRLPATRAPRIFLAGPPGSGKGTLGAQLAALTGAPHVSTGELLRTLVRTQPEAERTQQIQAFMSEGKLVPATIMRDLVRERFAAPDCRMFGVILDGYPPSLDDLANLTACGIAPDVVFYFDCSDATAIARQVERNARSTDTPERAAERLRVFHAADAGFEALAARWYPDRLVVRVDAEQSPAVALATVVETLRNTFAGARRSRSYFPIPPAAPGLTRSTRMHLHVDATDHRAIRAIARDIAIRHKPAQGQLKIYPIDALALAPQHGRMPIYAQLPNFHSITEPSHEAFITGRLGDGDRALMQIVLEVVRAHGGMAELEEYAGEWTLRGDGAVVADTEYALLDEDHAYPAYAANRCTNIPRWELHHGFDVPKQGDFVTTPPLPLAELVGASSAAGLDNGGWFLFANDRHWAYRSNEFADGSLADARARLFEQAQALQALLVARSLAVDIGFSLERVHGIWTWPAAAPSPG